MIIWVMLEESVKCDVLSFCNDIIGFIVMTGRYINVAVTTQIPIWKLHSDNVSTLVDVCIWQLKPLFPKSLWYLTSDCFYNYVMYIN